MGNLETPTEMSGSTRAVRTAGARFVAGVVIFTAFGDGGKPIPGTFATAGGGYGSRVGGGRDGDLQVNQIKPRYEWPRNTAAIPAKEQRQRMGAN